MPAPIIFTWTDDGVMKPHARFGKLCDQAFVVGENYRLEVVQERSQASHSHYFATLNEAWRNLPEDVAERFPTSEHLRKWCLIKAGFADQRSIVCASKAEAQRYAAFIRPMDEFSIVVPSEAVVTVYTAKSQSKRAMGAKVFQASKIAVLDIVAGMLRVELQALVQQARSAA